MAAVGTDAGADIVATFQKYGYQLFLYGAMITIFPMVIAALVGKWFFKMNLLSLLGAIRGRMTSTPGLAAADSMTDSNAHSIAYATVYPVAMVLLIVDIQLTTTLL